MVGRDVFQMMGLIQNQPAVGRQHCRLLPVVGRLAYRQIGRQKMVVDYDNIGFRCPAARPEQEAAVEVRTLESGTKIGLGADFVPNLGGRSRRQVAQSAVSSVSGPPGDAQELIQLVLLQKGSLGRYGLMHPGKTEVIAPALQQREGGRVVAVSECLSKQGKVLAYQLLLKIDGVRADHRALSIGASPSQ